jgi:hypothetical protein
MPRPAQGFCVPRSVGAAPALLFGLCGLFALGGCQRETIDLLAQERGLNDQNPDSGSAGSGPLTIPERVLPVDPRDSSPDSGTCGSPTRPCPDGGADSGGGAGSEPVCAPGVGCHACGDDNDCTNRQNQPFCDTELRRCVQCRNATDCSVNGFTCSPLNHECERACDKAANCPGQGSAQLCKISAGVCVECEGDSDCRSSNATQSHCSLGRCVICGTDTQCRVDSPETPQCTNFHCECTSQSCPHGTHCDGSSGRCL